MNPYDRLLDLKRQLDAAQSRDLDSNDNRLAPYRDALLEMVRAGEISPELAEEYQTRLRLARTHGEEAITGRYRQPREEAMRRLEALANQAIDQRYARPEPTLQQMLDYGQRFALDDPRDRMPAPTHPELEHLTSHHQDKSIEQRYQEGVDYLTGLPERGAKAFARSLAGMPGVAADLGNMPLQAIDALTGTHIAPEHPWMGYEDQKRRWEAVFPWLKDNSTTGDVMELGMGLVSPQATMKAAKGVGALSQMAMRGARTARRELPRDIEFLMDQLYPGRPYVPFESAVTGTGLETTGNWPARNSFKRFANTEKALGMRENIPAADLGDQPMHIGRGMWQQPRKPSDPKDFVPKMELNPLYVQRLGPEYATPGPIKENSLLDQVANHVGTSGEQEGIGPYIARPSLFEETANSYLVPDLDRRTFKDMVGQHHGDFLFRDNPDLGGTLITGFTDDPDPRILEMLARYGLDAVPYRIKSRYINPPKSSGAGRVPSAYPTELGGKGPDSYSLLND